MRLVRCKQLSGSVSWGAVTINAELTCVAVVRTTPGHDLKSRTWMGR